MPVSPCDPPCACGCGTALRRWKVLTWMLVLLLTMWTVIDFHQMAGHPWRWALWLAPGYFVAWVSYLHWRTP